MFTKQELQVIIDKNKDAAEMGCSKSQGMVIIAQDELDQIARMEWSRRWSDLDNQDHAWRSEERNWGVESENA